MKKNFVSKVVSTLVLLALTVTFLFILKNENQPNLQSQMLREKHKKSLNNTSFQNLDQLDKKDRRKLNLPPNKYHEELWKLTLNPLIGRPTPEKLLKIKDKIRASRSLSRGVGDSENPWIDRGPNNVGGRTRAIMFDPNDVNNPPSSQDYRRVFAGGVSGGLWVNDDITDQNSGWQLVDGLDGTLSVSVIVYDPNDTETFYVGTGESYTFGLVVGTGIWKSEDAGVTWNKVFGGYEGVSGNNVEGVFYINDLVARDNNGVTELYASVASGLYAASIPLQTMSAESHGVYRSINDGISWDRMEIKNPSGGYENPNDIEIDANNNIWVTTTDDLSRSGGGDIFKSIDGVNFSLINTIPNAERTELEISINNPNLMWVAANVNDEADLFISEDGFETFTAMNEPNDADGGIPADDFARAQAYYDLEIEADTNDNLIVGGIDLFRSTDNGTSWTQISKWANTTELGPLNIPLVHPDQHAIVFRPGSDTELVFGNDGGIYYSEDITVAGIDENAIVERNKDYNTVQFYTGAIDVSTDEVDNYAGGTQDNGTQVTIGANEGSNNFTDFFGGDGAYTEIDGEDGYMIQSYYYNDHRYVNFPQINNRYQISTLQTDDNNNGNFINIAELDRNLDILYSNASQGSNYRIERISNFKNGKNGIESEFLTHPDLDARPSAMKASPYAASTTVLFVGTVTGNLFRVIITEDSNIWTEITGIDFVGSISDIELGTTDSKIFVTMHNYGVQSIWSSEDGGLNWRSIEGDLPDLPVKSILQNPLRSQELIIGTELGVWITPDYTVDSPSWIQSYNGMSDVTVLDLDLRPSDNQVLATTHGRGMFTSNFTAESLSLPETTNPPSKKIYLFPTVNDGFFTLKSKFLIGRTSLKVFNIEGKQVYSEIFEISESDKAVHLSVIKGIYFVTLSHTNHSEVQRILVYK